MNQIRRQIEETTSDYDREKLRESLVSGLFAKGKAQFELWADHQ